MNRSPPRLGDPARVTGVVFGCRPDQVAERVVLTPFVSLKAFRRQVEGELTPLSPPFFYKGFTAAFAGVPVTVLHTGVGSSRVGDCMSFLALTPARRVVFAGAVGGLAPEHRIGDWFAPTAVAEGEGYTRSVERPFDHVVAGAPRLEGLPGRSGGAGRFLADRDFTVHEGPLFTVGCIAVESPENLDLLARAGYDAIEMELSAFHAAARRHGLEVDAFTYVSDLPRTRSLWDDKTPAETAALRSAHRVLPELALAWAVRESWETPRRSEIWNAAVSGPPVRGGDGGDCTC